MKKAILISNVCVNSTVELKLKTREALRTLKKTTQTKQK
jgi:hypothetical protein